jgi:predicted anti-sigma-YlaC factor YlaD
MATTCLGVRRAVSLVLDGELPSTDVAGVAFHLLGCESCCRFAGVAAELTQSLRTAAFVLPGGSEKNTSAIGEQS